MIRGINSYSREACLTILRDHLAALLEGIRVPRHGAWKGQHGKRRLWMSPGEKPQVEGIKLRRDITVDDVVAHQVGQEMRALGPIHPGLESLLILVEPTLNHVQEMAAVDPPGETPFLRPGPGAPRPHPPRFK